MATAPSAGQTETLNGMRIYFETHGTGEALLLLHGFSGSSQDWLPSAPGWGPDFQIILPDLRGPAAPAFCRSRSAIKTRRPPQSRCSTAWESAPAKESASVAAATSSCTWRPGNQNASKPWCWSVRRLTFRHSRVPSCGSMRTAFPRSNWNFFAAGIRVVIRRFGLPSRARKRLPPVMTI